MKTVNTLPVISPSRGSIYKSPTSTKEKFKFPPIADTSAFLKKDLDKHIKNNDVSQVLKESRSPVAVDQRDTLDIQQDEVRETSNNLLFLRKKYNEARETCVKMEQEMNKTRIENEKLKAQENFWNEDLIGGQNRQSELRNALNLQQIKIEEAAENNRIYTQMLERLKQDKIADKIKYANMENAIRQFLMTLNTETQTAKKALQFGIQTKIVFNGVIRQIEEEDKKRQNDLSMFEKTLNAQEEADMKRAERQERSKEVAETAQNELKDSNEHQWREVQKVHKFLNFFLKRKIEREIRQYEAVEKAYQKIKASTGLADTREIVSKFVNREQTYSELLISIADYEKRIAELQKINEQRKAKIQSLKEVNLPSEKYKEDKPGDKPNLLETYKNLETVSDAYKNAKLVVEKTYSWIMQVLIKNDKAKKIFNNKYYEMYPKDKLSSAFLKVIETIKSDLSELKENDIEKILDEIDKTKVDEIMKQEGFISKNMRVKPFANKSERRKTVESPLNSKRSFQETETVETEGEHHNNEEQEAQESNRAVPKTKVFEEAPKAKK